MGEGTGGISAFVKCSNMRSVQKKSSYYSYNEDGLRNIPDPAARESGLECACENNNDFTVLVSGGR